MLEIQILLNFCHKNIFEDAKDRAVILVVFGRVKLKGSFILITFVDILKVR